MRPLGELSLSAIGGSAFQTGEHWWRWMVAFESFGLETLATRSRLAKARRKQGSILAQATESTMPFTILKSFCSAGETRARKQRISLAQRDSGEITRNEF